MHCRYELHQQRSNAPVVDGHEKTFPRRRSTQGSLYTLNIHATQKPLFGGTPTEGQQLRRYDGGPTAGIYVLSLDDYAITSLSSFSRSLCVEIVTRSSLRNGRRRSLDKFTSTIKRRIDEARARLERAGPNCYHDNAVIKTASLQAVRPSHQQMFTKSAASASCVYDAERVCVYAIQHRRPPPTHLQAHSYGKGISSSDGDRISLIRDNVFTVYD